MTQIDSTNIGNKRVTYIACGHYFTTILTIDGIVYSTGANESGQLGDNTLINKNIFTAMVLMPSNTLPKYISCGESHTVILMTNGTVYSTGSNKRWKVLTFLHEKNTE